MSELVRVDSWFITCAASAAVLGHVEASAAPLEAVEPELTHESWARVREAIGWHRSDCHPECECERCEKLWEVYETAWIERQTERDDAECERVDAETDAWLTECQRIWSTPSAPE